MHYNAGDFDLFTYLKNPQVFDVKNGAVELLTGAGLGIELDEELIRKNAKENAEFSWRNPTCESNGTPLALRLVLISCVTLGRGPDGGLREW
jgi:hypothetical protein